jgi:hypothetical protein
MKATFMPATHARGQNDDNAKAVKAATRQALARVDRAWQQHANSFSPAAA